MKGMLILFALLLVVGCPLEDCDSPTGPGNGTQPPPTNGDEPPPPDPAPERQGLGTHLIGVTEATAFGLRDTYDVDLGHETMQAFMSQYPARFMMHLQNKGYDTIRMGAQFDGWCGASRFYLPCDEHPPEVDPKTWKTQLIGVLDIADRLGMQVELIPTFTRKNWTDASALKAHVKLVVRVVQKAGVDSVVVWSAFNELWHPNSSEAAKSSLNAILKLLPHPRGLDFPSNGLAGDLWRGRIPLSVRTDLIDWGGFHGSRNPEPTEAAFRRTRNDYAFPIWINETVSYTKEDEIGRQDTHLGPKSWLFTGMKYCDPRKSTFNERKCNDIDTHRDQAREEKQAINRAGLAGYCFHGLWLFSYEGASTPLDWAPRI